MSDPELAHPELAPGACPPPVACGPELAHVPPAQVAAFENEMREAGVDWQLVAYGGAVHAFTDPSAGTDPSRGAAYNATADRRSREALRSFLAEVLND